MSSRARIHRGEDRTDINISPMIDMVFILLIFFIVTTVFVEEEGLNVDKPTPAPPQTEQEEKEEPVMILVTANNQIQHNKKTLTLSNVETIVRESMSKNPELPVIMKVERGALAGIMIQVMDRAKIGGADKISVTSVDG